MQKKQNLSLIMLMAILGLLLSSMNAQSSFDPVDQMRFDLYGNDMNVRILEKPYIPNDKLVDLYIDESWLNGSIELPKGQEVEGCVMRYNVSIEKLEFLDGTKVKMLGYSSFNSFQWADKLGSTHTFKSGMNYWLNDGPMYGVIEELYIGEISLYRRVSLKTIEPNGIPSFNVGSRDTKYSTRTRFYMARDEHVLLEIPRSKSQAFKLFKEHKDVMKKYITENGLRIKKAEDLKKIIKFYSDLVRK